MTSLRRRAHTPGLWTPFQNPQSPPGSEVELIGRSLSPEHVAERVLRAVRANRLYVITHEEGR
ncbi:MAG: hypothetical protein HYS36_08390, partial [Candidatus Rokubacteria bacterium]|nr:hypothetical protein [Candidatus Rokubacteria bacterium]